MKLPRHSSKRGRVEIIPLIDTVLILLIFYMSFSTFQKKEQHLRAPLPVFTDKGPPPVEVLIQIRSTGELTVNETVYDAATLHHLLGTIAVTDPRTSVIISADPTTKYHAVIRAMDVCAQANLRKVAFQPLHG